MYYICSSADGSIIIKANSRAQVVKFAEAEEFEFDTIEYIDLIDATKEPVYE